MPFDNAKGDDNDDQNSKDNSTYIEITICQYSVKDCTHIILFCWEY